MYLTVQYKKVLITKHIQMLYMFRNEKKLISLPVALPSSPMPKLTEKNVILFLPHKVRKNQLNLILIYTKISVIFYSLNI
jgi:hypothetical protein